MKAMVKWFLIMLLLDCGENYRILGLFPLPVQSHVVMFKRLMEGLAEKGHEVDVLSHYPMDNPPLRYHDISPLRSLPVLANNISIPFARSTLGSWFDTMKFIILEGGLVDTCRAILNTTVAEKLKSTKIKYDLIITEIFGSDCMLGFGHHLKVPVISITSSVNLPWGGSRIGNPDNPAYIPTYFLPYLSKMGIVERVANTAILLIGKLGYRLSAEISTGIAREFFGTDLPHLTDLAYNTSLVFVNSHFSIHQARPTVPNFIEVGGLHIKPLQPLSKNFSDSLNIGTEYQGVIYLSMGTMVLTETLPFHKLSALFEVFRKMPFKIMWKASIEDMPKHFDIPGNIQFESWMPQFDILCHPNVKLFITHGGLMGTQESVFCGVPSLAIPLFADQELNAKAAEAMGYSITVDYEDMTKESVSTALDALLGDPRYKANAERISKLFKDRPLSALETAIYWVEYVIRHKGAPHLRSAGADLPWYQYFLLDVVLLLVLLLAIAVILTYYIVLFMIRMLFRNKKTRKYKSN